MTRYLILAVLVLSTVTGYGRSTEGDKVVNDDYGDYVLVPAGEFPMGDNFNEGVPGELPVHTVYLDAFYIGKYPVTNVEYKKFMDDGGYVTRSYWKARGYGDFGLAPRYWDHDHDPFFKGPDGEEVKVHGGGLPGTENFPVVGVNWYEAMAYCSWLSVKTGHTYRLPTEAEWEKAARGTYELNRDNLKLGHQRRYPWGDAIDGTYANFLNSGDAYDNGATPVGYYDGSTHGALQTKDNASPYGAYDMIGNVWEWCSDWRSETYYQECYDKGTVKNPTGPPSGTYRIVRGSDWHHDAFQNNNGLYHDPRCAWRNSEVPSVTGSNFGFRCVREK